MSKVRIVTDSNAFLAPDVVEKYQIEVVPHRIKIAGSLFEEDSDFTADDLFEKIHEAQRMGMSTLPEVQAPSVNTFLDYFQHGQRKGEQIVAIHMSGQMSPMWAQARKAAEMLKGRYTIRVLDSQSTSFGLGLLVQKAAEAAEAGATVNEIARIVNNVTEEEFEKRPCLMTIVNTNSPLKLDNNMLMGMMELSSRGQIVCVTPFTLAGAMAPVTIAGAVTQQNAEALAGLAFCQLVKKGAPVVYGGFTSNVDMKSGAPAFGTPEYMKSTILGGQMARRYGVPYRTSNTCAANTVDAQAAYESVFSLWGVTMGGGNYIMHGAGWMEGGLVASFEKFVLDCDLIQMVKSFLKPLDTSPDALALDAIREVGPGGHFFGAQHTLARYSEAFYQPIISDWRNYQQWTAAGSPDAYKRANQVYKQALQNYVQPDMPAAVRAELDAFVDRRVKEGGVKTDF